MNLRKITFIRDILCAMLISMTFSFVLTFLGSPADGGWNRIPPTFSDLRNSFVSDKAGGGHLWFAGLWMVFYLGIMLDDFMHEMRKGPFAHLAPPCIETLRTKNILFAYLLVASWVLFFIQTCSLVSIRVSALCGGVGLIAGCIALSFDTHGWWQKGPWLLENVLLIAAMWMFWQTGTCNRWFVVFLAGVMLVEKVLIQGIVAVIRSGKALKKSICKIK